jgi:hypothetical protein
MNKYVAMGIGAVVGGGVGYVIGYLIAERMAKNEEENSFEETVPMEEADEGDETKDEEPSSPPFKRKEREIVTGPRKVINYNDIFIAAEKPELAALAAKYAGIDNEPAKVMVSRALADDEMKDPKAPRIISEAEFDAHQDQDYFRYLVLTYYAGDDVLVAPNLVPIMEPEKVVGSDALNSFGLDPEQDADTIYVVNEKLGGIYEVVRVEESFVEPEPKIVHKNIFKDAEER